jgi:hypothetical protein
MQAVWLVKARAAVRATQASNVSLRVTSRLRIHETVKKASANPVHLEAGGYGKTVERKGN